MKTEMTIFIVDDDPFWRLLLSQVLIRLGYDNLHSFSNGNDCISNLHLSPKIIFLDHEMEGMDGISTLKELRILNQHIAVVLCTAHEEMSVAINAIALGAASFVLKENLDIKEINRSIENLYPQISNTEIAY